MATTRRDNARALSLISPVGIYAFVFLAVPLVSVVVFSFWTQNLIALDRTPTLANYQTAVEEPIFRVLMVRSLLIAAIVSGVTVVLAFPVAYYVSFHVPQGRKAMWIFLITIPFWMSYLIRIFLWKVILGYNGVINSALMSVGIIDAPLTQIAYNPTAVVITLAHAFAPFAILPMFVALERIDRNLIEASRDLGETAARTFVRVTLPLAMPGIIASALIVFIPTVGDYVTPRLVGGPNGLMIANMIYAQFLRLNDAPMGAALAVISMVLVALICGAVLVMCRKYLRRGAS